MAPGVQAGDEPARVLAPRRNETLPEHHPAPRCLAGLERAPAFPAPPGCKGPSRSCRRTRSPSRWDLPRRWGRCRHRSRVRRALAGVAAEEAARAGIVPAGIVVIEAGDRVAVACRRNRDRCHTDDALPVGVHSRRKPSRARRHRRTYVPEHGRTRLSRPSRCYCRRSDSRAACWNRSNFPPPAEL